MLRYGSVLVLILGGWAALDPASMSWIHNGVVAAFELWLLWQMRRLARTPVAVNQPPYGFTAEEAELIGRYRLYFVNPAMAADAASVLSAIGLSSVVLALWLTFKGAPVQGALLGLNLFAVGWLTKRAAPVYALRVAASRGKRDALRMLEILEPLWAKIREANKAS